MDIFYKELKRSDLSGSFNRCYFYKDCRKNIWVVKVLIDDGSYNFSDLPARSVRVFNEVNSPLIQKKVIREAEEVRIIKKDGSICHAWAAPLIRGEAVSDEEARDTFEEVYRRTGRIIVDGNGSGNLKKLSTGQIVCIDIGFALLLHTPSMLSLKRSPSISSFLEWSDVNKEYPSYWAQISRKGYPQSVRFLKNIISKRHAHQPEFIKVLEKLVKLLRAIAQGCNSDVEGIIKELNLFNEEEIDILKTATTKHQKSNDGSYVSIVQNHLNNLFFSSTCSSRGSTKVSKKRQGIDKLASSKSKAIRFSCSKDHIHQVDQKAPPKNK